MKVLSVRLDDELQRKLERRAAILRSTKSDVVREAIGQMNEINPRDRDQTLAEVRRISQSIPASRRFKESPVITLRRKKHLYRHSR